MTTIIITALIASLITHYVQRYNRPRWICKLLKIVHYQDSCYDPGGFCTDYSQPPEPWELDDNGKRR